MRRRWLVVAVLVLGSFTLHEAPADAALYEDGSGVVLGWEFCTPRALCDEFAGPAGSDGRYHQCGLVTEHGVTEHLDAYAARCGR